MTLRCLIPRHRPLRPLLLHRLTVRRPTRGRPTRPRPLPRLGTKGRTLPSDCGIVGITAPRSATANPTSTCANSSGGCRFWARRGGFTERWVAVVAVGVPFSKIFASDFPYGDFCKMTAQPPPPPPKASNGVSPTTVQRLSSINVTAPVTIKAFRAVTAIRRWSSAPPMSVLDTGSRATQANSCTAPIMENGTVQSKTLSVARVFRGLDRRYGAPIKSCALISRRIAAGGMRTNKAA
jgi:hypothetical protein